MNPTLPLTPHQFDAYCERIGYAGPSRADAATLRALHRAHVLAIPFENIDVQLGLPPGREPEAIFAKLVTRRRGGWCYEQNGLFGRALAALGFAVTPLSGGVMREERGAATMGSHLALKVSADGQDWLADVGFGSAQRDPLPLTDHAWDQGAVTGTLGRTADGYWRLAITAGPSLLSYDFRDAAADPEQLDALCAWQGRDAQSVFVQNLVVQQRRPDGHTMLRGKVLTQTARSGPQQRELSSADELTEVLRTEFALDVPEAACLWPAIEARHAALFA